jgi:mono/diheme cytochrome c family protein
MNKLPTPIRPLLVLAAMAALALAVSACGTTTASVDNGRVLFIENCGTCHTLAEAGTTAEIGPNLDDAFASARAAGEGGETIEGIVKAQVEYPRPSNGDPAVSMPRDVVEGQDLEDVAAYVGTWAGVPGAAPPKVPGGPGAQVFANNGCGGCHTLKAANSGGQVGPNLDEVLSGQSASMIEESIVEPNAKIATGYPENMMPGNFGEVLSPEELKNLVQFLSEETGGEGVAAKGGSAPAKGEGAMPKAKPSGSKPAGSQAGGG